MKNLGLALDSKESTVRPDWNSCCVVLAGTTSFVLSRINRRHEPQKGHGTESRVVVPGQRGSHQCCSIAAPRSAIVCGIWTRTSSTSEPGNIAAEQEAMVSPPLVIQQCCRLKYASYARAEPSGFVNSIFCCHSSPSCVSSAIIEFTKRVQLLRRANTIVPCRFVERCCWGNQTHQDVVGIEAIAEIFNLESQTIANSILPSHERRTNWDKMGVLIRIRALSSIVDTAEYLASDSLMAWYQCESQCYHPGQGSSHTSHRLINPRHFQTSAINEACPGSYNLISHCRGTSAATVNGQS